MLSSVSSTPVDRLTLVSIVVTLSVSVSVSITKEELLTVSSNVRWI